MKFHQFTEHGVCYQCDTYQRNAQVAHQPGVGLIHLCDICVELIRTSHRTKVEAKGLLVRILRRVTNR